MSAIVAGQEMTPEARRRRTIVLAVAHAALAVLFLATFIVVQLHRG